MNKKLLSVFILFACGLSVYSQVLVRKVKPADTDNQITTFTTDSHYVYLNTTVAAKNILVVHLPGSFGEPKRATLFGSLAANLGFHSIGLMYPNVPTVGSFCTNSADVDCFEDVRREIVEGVDYSADIAIAPAEGIINRVQKLLVYLNTTYPTENWGQYLDVNNNPVYSKIIFSGHSQGGGHAALIAKFYPLKRAICFSSPKDWRNQPDAPPLWLSSGSWQTSAAEIYCFNHTLDEHTNHQLEIWDSLGLNAYGPPVNVDSFAAPYSNTRQLTTSYNVPAGDDHASTIQDNKTPKVNNVPVFLPVWTYMLTNNLLTGLADDVALGKVAMQLSPNPANHSVNVTLPQGNFQLMVYDATGRLVLATPSQGSTHQLNLSGLTAGLYIINAQNNTYNFSGKLIKQ